MRNTLRRWLGQDVLERRIALLERELYGEEHTRHNSPSVFGKEEHPCPNQALSTTQANRSQI